MTTWAIVIGILIAIVVVFTAGTVQVGRAETVPARLIGLAVIFLTIAALIFWVTAVRNILRYLTRSPL